MVLVQLSLSARNLRNVAGLFKGISDPYAVLEMSGGLELGRTERIHDDLSPKWAKLFLIDYIPGTYVYAKVTVYDDNKGKRNDKYMGEATFEIGSILHCPENIIEETLDMGGKIIMHANEVQYTGTEPPTRGSLNLQIRALDLKNVEDGILNLGCSDPFYEISKKFTKPSIGLTRWLIVYRSAHQFDVLNPLWDPANIGMDELCDCDLDAPLKISVWDWERKARHRIIGSLVTTARQIIENIAVKGNADRDKAMPLLPDKSVDGTADRGSWSGNRRKEIGKLVILKAELIDSVAS